MKSEQPMCAALERAVRSIRSGDRAALEAMFADQRAYLRHVISLRIDQALRLRVDPSDIIQEAQLEAVRCLEEYVQDPKLPVRLWMRQLAIQRLNMAHRRHVSADKRSVYRQMSLPEQSSLAIAGQLAAEMASPSGDAMQKEVSRQVQDAVAQLEEMDREIILLQAYEGLNSTESAQALGIEPAAARKRYGRALLRLRQRLVENGLGESTT